MLLETWLCSAAILWEQSSQELVELGVMPYSAGNALHHWQFPTPLAPLGSPLPVRAQPLPLRWRFGHQHRHNKPLFLFPLSLEPFLSHIPACLASSPGLAAFGCLTLPTSKQ